VPSDPLKVRLRETKKMTDTSAESGMVTTQLRKIFLRTFRFKAAPEVICANGLRYNLLSKRRTHFCYCTPQVQAKINKKKKKKREKQKSTVL